MIDELMVHQWMDWLIVGGLMSGLTVSWWVDEWADWPVDWLIWWLMNGLTDLWTGWFDGWWMGWLTYGLVDLVVGEWADWWIGWFCFTGPLPVVGLTVETLSADSLKVSWAVDNSSSQDRFTVSPSPSITLLWPTSYFLILFFIPTSSR